jgi:hypothetical protein
MHAMLRLIRELKEAGEDAFINLTSGTLLLLLLLLLLLVLLSLWSSASL